MDLWEHLVDQTWSFVDLWEDLVDQAGSSMDLWEDLVDQEGSCVDLYIFQQFYGYEKSPEFSKMPI